MYKAFLTEKVVAENCQIWSLSNMDSYYDSNNQNWKSVLPYIHCRTPK